MIRKTIVLLLVSAAIIGAGYGGGRLARTAVDALEADEDTRVPTAIVRRSDVAIEVRLEELSGRAAIPRCACR